MDDKTLQSTDIDEKVVTDQATDDQTSDQSEETNPATDAQTDNSEVETPTEVTDETETTDETPAEEVSEPEAENEDKNEPATSEEVTESPSEESTTSEVAAEESEEIATEDADTTDETPAAPALNDNPNGRWYVVHTFSGHENKVLANLSQKIASEHLENRIFQILVPTQEKIEIRGGKKEQVKEKIFPGYILVKMELSDESWLAVRTTPGVTGFVGIGNKPTPIPEGEVRSIMQFMTQEAAPTFKDVFMADDTVKIIDGPFAEFIGKVESVDKERGKVKVLVSIFGRETPVELDFLQVTKL